MRQFRLIVGAYNLSDQFEDGRISSGVKSYKVHRGWNAFETKYHADIAIVELISEVTFNRYVKPICLSREDLTDFNTGSLAGWGHFDDFRRVSDVPRKITVNVIADGQCFRDDPRLVIASSEKMFCAGKRGVAVCPGDSGSGLYVLKEGKFYLKGIVSSAVGDQCTEGYLALYTDVVKYSEFIQEFVSDLV